MSKPPLQAPGTGATIVYPPPARQVMESLEGLPESEIITFSLNGRDVKARKGESIIDVCHREDVYVPHYCWHPALSIAGNCRLCLVEMEKSPKPVIACQTHVAPGMIIRTESAVAKESREWMMEFLLVNHPLDCPICDRGGECQLQRYSMEYGTGHTRMADKKRKFVKPQADPLIDIERNRCIMCTRCVRFCDEVGGEHVMGVFDRGDGNYIGTFGQGPVSNIFSGNVIDLCPVGCLTSRPYRFKARPWELKQTQSTCDGCSSGCKVTTWTRNGKLYRTTPPSRKRHAEFTINEDTEEFICNQGRFGSDYGFHSSRVDDMMVRRAGRLGPTSFQDALATAARELLGVRDSSGSQSVAVALGSRLTIEEAHLANRFAREVLNTGNIDWRTMFASTEAANAVSLALDAADGDLEHDPDVILVVGGNLVAQSPVLAMRLQELGRRLEKTIIMIGHHHDPYLADHASERFHVLPGAVADVLEKLASAVSSRDVASLADALHVEQSVAQNLVDTLSKAGRGLVIQGLDDFSGLNAPTEVPAAIRLRRALGGVWGYLPVVSARNAVGLHAVGAEPEDGAVPGKELLAAIEQGRIRALLVVGADSLSHVKDQQRLVAALARLQSLVVIDSFSSPVSEQASVFLALATNIERNGVMADAEGSIALLKQAEAPRGDSREGWQILTGLGRAAGAGAKFGAETAEECWAQARHALATESKLTLAELELEGSSNVAHFATRQHASQARNRSKIYNPGSYRTDGLRLRGRVPDVALPAPRTGSVTRSQQLLLTWGPHISGRGYFADRAIIANVLLPKPFAELHPADAAELGLKNDQFAVIHAEGAKAKVAIKISKGPARGTVYLSGGTYGPFDASSLSGPVPVRLEGLAESAPDQGTELVAGAAGRSQE
jgi:NADH-quinone oxidoreductase subunit G